MAAAAAAAARSDTSPQDLHSVYPPVPNSPGPSERQLDDSITTAPELPGTDTDLAGDNREGAVVGASRTLQNAATVDDGGIASANTEADPITVLTPALRTRLGLFRRLQVGVLALKSRSRFILIFQGFFMLAQVAAFIVILAISGREQCSKPLRTYLALHVVRVAISYPVNFYITLAPPSRPPRGQEDTPESRARREARRVIGSPRLDLRLRSMADMIAIFSLIWFCLGNYWIYSDTTCKTSSPRLWWSGITTLIIAYLRVAEVLVIILAVVFFLPAVILGLRLFGGFEKKHEIGPLSKDEISRIPVVYYVPEKKQASEGDKPDTSLYQQGPSDNLKASDQRKQQAVSDAASSEAEQQDRGPHRTRRFVRLLLQRKQREGGNATSNIAATRAQGDDYIATPHPLHALPDNLSSCPICLSDYEPPPLRSACVTASERKKAIQALEELNLLPCNHAIHKDCLSPWLQTSGRCPVCQRAILEAGSGKANKRGGVGTRRNSNRQQGADTSAATSPDPANEAPAATADGPSQVPSLPAQATGPARHSEDVGNVV